MLIIPTLVALGFLFFGGKKVTIIEFTIQMVVQIALMGGLVSIQSCQNTQDTETWNGRVTEKKREIVSCSHSYQCNCRTYCSGSDNTRSCHQICSTCYEHSYDVDWAVYTSLDERLEINRINRQGTEEPPRWTAVKIGEPTSTIHNYENYVKAAPDSLFRHQGSVEKYKGQLPSYPQNVYDYYKMDRVVIVGSIPITVPAWNNMLSEVNATLGKQKQSNIILVLVQNKPADYFQALQQYWIGAKKNDIVAVISLDGENIQWVEIMAWTQDKMIEVTLADELRGLITINDSKLESVAKSLNYNVDVYYKRKPMKDFEYLASTVTPTFGQWLFAMIFGLVVSVGIGFFMYNNDHDDDDLTTILGRRI